MATLIGGSPDHPRSRGVYSFRCGCWGCGEGSSPLARGLRQAARGAEGAAGIIPARAGFTTCAPWSDWSPPDHPRSRGVYAFVERSHMWEWGSSPLARGLREDRVPGGYQFGIIPARAGFTRRPPLRRGPSPDHPRSRGVYTYLEWCADGVPGSSPLARGLLSGFCSLALQTGIIPARAGFTEAYRQPAMNVGDHPRSRGVYLSTNHLAFPGNGSSPLARGLLQVRVPSGAGAGIIPARAGFTSRHRARWPGCSDHPRSRGVYTFAQPGPCGTAGSSPLARGLPVGHGAGGSGAGIIPARAGFTATTRPRWPQSRDHPRSRGVYGFTGAYGTGGTGSSPLARGLHR